MAEIKPYSLIRSQRKTMFTRVKMSAEEEINRSVYTSVVRSRTETGKKRKECLCCKEIEEAVNKISGEYYFCIQQMLIILALGR